MPTLQQAVDVVSRYHVGQRGVTAVTAGSDDVIVHIDSHKIYPSETTRQILEREALPFKVKIVDSSDAQAFLKAKDEEKHKQLFELRKKHYDHIQAPYAGGNPLCGCHVVEVEHMPLKFVHVHPLDTPQHKDGMCPECFKIRKMTQRDYDRAKARMNQHKSIK